jgi:von Willebrand factor type A domain
MTHRGARGSRLGSMALVFAAVGVVLAAWPAQAQPASTNLQGFGLKIYKVESALYPFVQVYLRTFDQNKDPLVNLNELNIGVMMKGRSYDPVKRQYFVQSIRNRSEAVRSVIVIDCSKTMAGEPFDEARKAAARFIDSKRAQDQVALIAIRDTDTGYEIASNFERDAAALGRRLRDLQCDGQKTRLYDSIAAAMSLCGFVSQGGINTTDAEYILSNSIIVISDGKDEGSAISRGELNNRITNLKIPIPIYSLAYSRVDKTHLLNMEALSMNSFGIYFPIGESVGRMQQTVEKIQNILQSDYVVTIRAYLPVDGEKHGLKIGLEYPSKSGKAMYQSAYFEAIEAPPVEKILSQQAQLDKAMPAVPDGDPYYKRRDVAAPAAQ